MSASLFDLGVYDVPTPNNWCEAIEGERTFGSLQKGNVIYVFDGNEIIEAIISDPIKIGKTVYFRTKPFGKYKDTKINFGPTRAGRLGNFCGIGKEWDSGKVAKSTLVGPFSEDGFGNIYGTERSSVRLYALTGIYQQLKKCSREIQNIQTRASELQQLTKSL